jgi:hypothetical protein
VTSPPTPSDASSVTCAIPFIWSGCTSHWK